MKTKMLAALVTTSLLLATGLAHSNVISCKLKNGSAIAISFHDTTATYSHYNKAGTMDLQLPVTSFGHYLGATGYTNQYRFLNGAYSYMVVESGGRDGNWYGLQVFKGEKQIAEQECVGLFNIDGLPVPGDGNDLVIPSESE